MGCGNNANSFTVGGRGDLIEKILTWLKQYVNLSTKKGKYILLIALIGILLILMSNVLTKEKGTSPYDQQNEPDISLPDSDIEEVSLTTDVNEIESSYNSNLEAMLNQIKGISEVEVMVNVDSTNVQVYEKDLIVGAQTTDETDKNGGERTVEDETKETKLVYVRQGDQEVPIKVQTKKPDVRGVFVVAKGVDDPSNKQLIVESISKVLDVPTYRISVMPK
jgi:stage III sporulation protein AG